MNKQTIFKKHISTFSLLMTGITSILGSGWLLSTQKISEISGPAGILSWVVGALVVMLVSLFFLEIGTRYPSAGGIGYYSNITHGRFCGFLTSWINWLSVVAVPPIEAQAIIQYLSNLPGLQVLYNPMTHALTPLGMGWGMVCMLFFMWMNYWTVYLFVKFNNFFTIIKIVIPLLTIGCLVYEGISMKNFVVHDGGFLPFGWSSIFGSVISCGVVMSFNGFQSPLTFSEEIPSPKRMLPIAVLGSILITFLIYFFLQITFIGSMTPEMLAKGWQGINFRSPYIELLTLANFHLVVLSIYVGAVVSPGACGATFLASSARVVFSLSREKHLPGYLSQLNPHYHNPRYAVITCTLIGCIFLFAFKGWYSLVAVISILHVFSYVPAPIIALANRKEFPEIKQEQFLLPFGKTLALLLLFVLSVLLFYAAWPLTIEILILLVPGLFFYVYYERQNFDKTDFLLHLLGGSWLILYLIGIALITYLGENHNRAYQLLSIQQSMVALLALSLFTLWYGVHIVSYHINLESRKR